MSKKMAGVLAAYGVVLIILGFLAPQQAPTFSKTTLIAGLAGGGLCVLWGGIAFAGYKHRSWAVLTLVAVAVVMLFQVVQAWLAYAEMQSAGLAARLVPTIMFVKTVGMLMYVLHGERSAEFYRSGSGHGNSPSSPDGNSQRTAGGRRP